LPEDPRSLTAPGVAPGLRDVNRSKFTKGDRDESIRITQAYKLGMQVSCGVYTEVPEESALWVIESRAWGGISGAGRREGKRYHRGAADAGSCAHDDLSATEVFDGASNRVHEGQECDPYCSCVCRTNKELRWAELLGKRVLGIDGGKRRGSSTSLSLGAGERLKLGNLDIYRDWGWAPDYVDAMWRILQQMSSEDFVIASGKMHSLHDFLNKTFLALGLNSSDYVDSDSSLLRPVDIAMSVGNPEKAKLILGWHTKTNFDGLKKV